MRNFFRKTIEAVHRFATWYEPTIAKAVVAAFFQMLLTVGIAVGDWPAKVDGVLAFVTVVVTLLAGRSIRKSVYSPATHQAEVVDHGIREFVRGRRAAENGRQS